MTVNEKNRTAEYLLSLIENVDTKAYFLLLKYILHFFNFFNAFFQAHETRIHLLQSKSVNFLIQISQLQNFLKAELIKHLLTGILFHKIENYKSFDNITLGSECEEYLSELVKKGHANVTTIIRQNCLQFYITAAEEIRKRLSVNHVFLYKLKVFQPNIVLFYNNREILFNDIFFIAKTLHGFDEEDLGNEWLTLHSDFTIEEKQDLAKSNFHNMWKNILKCQSINSNPKYPNLRSLLNSIK